MKDEQEFMPGQIEMGELQEAMEELINTIDSELIKVKTNTQLYHNEEFVKFIKTLTRKFDMYLLEERNPIND